MRIHLAIVLISFFISILLPAFGFAQNDRPFLSRLKAGKDDPLYTTYAATMKRSEYVLDEGFHLRYYQPTKGIDLTTDTAGDWCLAFRRDSQFVYVVKEMFWVPVITASYPDMVCYYYYPFEHLKVEITFLVYSSRLALQDIQLTNESAGSLSLTLYSFLKNDQGPFKKIHFLKEKKAITFVHEEKPDNWSLQHHIPHVDNVYDLFLISLAPDRMTGFRQIQVGHIANRLASDQSFKETLDSARVLLFRKKFTLQAGVSLHFRVLRGFGKDDRERLKIIRKAETLLQTDLKPFLQKDETLLSGAPVLPVADKDRQLLYWSAFNMMRQVFLPPEGKCHFNYYVFSREPTWGWGHGGQVFHESLSMMAYALLDPQSAMDSQRIFKERQHADGYINYRTGPYLDETIEYHGELTSSAPWYAWENWQVYSISGDKAFLREMYRSSEKLYRYFVTHRDKDGDGLCEWGGHAVLESVRDGEVAVWDQVGWPSDFEALDLNCMLVMEAKSLAKMARALGKKQEANHWQKEAEQRSVKINQTFWDEETGFYYHVDKRDNDFTFKTKNDLKRQEIIGFLPLWAGIASKAQARRLLQTLTDTNKFWRKFGVPSLAANDPYYNPQGYWNGPVWVEWNYLIMVGLLNYGYNDLARALVDKVASNMIAILKKNHNLWEFYSPDAHWAGYHRTYIWAGIINRMMLDVAKINKK